MPKYDKQYLGVCKTYLIRNQDLPVIEKLRGNAEAVDEQGNLTGHHVNLAHRPERGYSLVVESESGCFAIDLSRIWQRDEFDIVQHAHSGPNDGGVLVFGNVYIDTS